MIENIVIIISLFILGIIAQWRIDVGIVLLCTLLPAYLLRTQIGPIPTTFLELGICVVFLVWFFKLLKTKEKLSISKKEKKFLVLVSLFFLAAIISVFVSPHKRTSLGVLRAWFFDPLVLGFLVWRNIRVGYQRMWVIIGLLVSGLVLALGGIFQFLSGGPTYDLRITSVFENANYLALFLGPIFILGFGILILYFKKINKFLKIGIIISLLFLGLAICLTRSYAGLISLFVGIAFLGLFLKRRKRIWYGGALILLLLFFIEFPTTKFQNVLDLDSGSLASRFQIWRVSLAMIYDYPILGIGLGTFEPIYQKYLPHYFFPPQEWVVREPHNLILSFWLNAGILGLLSFLGIVVWFFGRTTKIYQQKTENYLFSVILMAAMIGVLVHGLWDVPYFKNDLSALFWILIALAFGLEPPNPFLKRRHKKAFLNQNKINCLLNRFSRHRLDLRG